MRYTKDEKLRGHAMVCDSLLEAVEGALTSHKGAYLSMPAFTMPEWIGRTLPSWDAVKKATWEQWDWGAERVEYMLKKIDKSKLPHPVQRRRTGRWNELEGEIDSDRALRGEPELYRIFKRHPSQSPNTIVLTTFVGANCGTRHEDIFWGPAAAISMIDILEEAGYSCEVWSWVQSTGCYSGTKTPDCFTAVKLKEAGDPLNKHNLINGMSAWFFRTIVFGTWFAAWKQGTEKSEPTSWLGHCSEYNAERWLPYIDAVESCQNYAIPQCLSEDAAKRAIDKLLQDVIDKNQ